MIEVHHTKPKMGLVAPRLRAGLLGPPSLPGGFVDALPDRRRSSLIDYRCHSRLRSSPRLTKCGQHM